MVRTDRSTGSRRSRDRRMEVSRERSGNTHPDISATGKRIRRTVSAFNSTKTVTNMRVYGSVISDMAKELTGVMRLESCVVNTQATGTKTKSMDVVPSSIRTATDTMATGLLECLKEREE
jgi:hypothetical protein